MKELIHRPAASALVSSLRAIGYSFASALADIIDNSIAAGARLAAIKVRTGSDPYVAIRDDGSGMSPEGLLAAMRHGVDGPITPRDPTDLGRFGLGLKTASLSQCRTLTVATTTGHGVTAARWDIDHIEARGDWSLLLLAPEDIEALPDIAALREGGHGTVVVWSHFDRAVAGAASPGRALERLVDEAREHLGLVFHRFLAPDPGESQVTITINELPVQPLDPFLSSNKRTEALPRETVNVAGSTVVIQPYILPHLSNLTDAEIRSAGGHDTLRQTQGFYVYRNRRLITAGTWFRMLRQDELNKLARVKVDVPNTLDHLWDLDVKKSRATPPEEVRNAMRRIIERIAARSQNVFRDRRRRHADGSVTHLWVRQRVRGGFCYGVNREHRAVREAYEGRTIAQQRELDRLLTLLEVGLPASDIYACMASDQPVELPEDQVASGLREQLRAWMSEAGDDASARAVIIDSLPHLEPFSMYPTVTKMLIQEMT